MRLTTEAAKDVFVEELTKTNRPGMDKVIAGLEEIGFFTAPASSKHHLAEPGGLLRHSVNVYMQALAIRLAEIKIRPEIEEKVPFESIAIAALLHDVCKAEVYKEVEKFRKDKNDRWEKYKTYGVDYSGLPLGHGEKSVVRLLRLGLEMTDDEMLAIRWHMQGFDLSDSAEARASYTAACAKSPLVTLIMAADLLASHLMDA